MAGLFPKLPANWEKRGKTAGTDERPFLGLNFNTDNLRRAVEIFSGRFQSSFEQQFKTAMRDALVERLREIIKERIIPVTPIKTGKLRSSIRLKLPLGAGATTMLKNMGFNRQGKLEMAIESRLNYSVFVHESFIEYEGSPVKSRDPKRLAWEDGTGGKFIEGVIVASTQYLLKSVGENLREWMEGLGARHVRRRVSRFTPGMGTITTRIGSDERSREPEWQLGMEGASEA